MDLPSITTDLKGLDLKSTKGISFVKDHCFTVCKGLTFEGKVPVPVDNFGWQYTYTVGFICAVLLTSVQLISVCCYQDKKKRGENGKYTELE